MFIGKTAQILSATNINISPATGIESLYFEKAEWTNDGSITVTKLNVGKHMSILMHCDNNPMQDFKRVNTKNPSIESSLYFGYNSSTILIDGGKRSYEIINDGSILINGQVYTINEALNESIIDAFGTPIVCTTMSTYKIKANNSSYLAVDFSRKHNISNILASYASHSTKDQYWVWLDQYKTQKILDASLLAVEHCKNIKDQCKLIENRLDVLDSSIADVNSIIADEDSSIHNYHQRRMADSSLSMDEFQSMVNNNELVFGKIYNIRYNAKEMHNGNINPYTDHEFWLQVIACDTNRISNKVLSFNIDGDQYFHNNHLEKWEIQYDLDYLNSFTYQSDSWYRVEDSKRVINEYNSNNNLFDNSEYYTIAASDLVFFINDDNIDIYNSIICYNIKTKEFKLLSVNDLALSITELNGQLGDKKYGKIIWMKDEFGNEAPYDFKNRKQINGNYYTFTTLEAQITDIDVLSLADANMSNNLILMPDLQKNNISNIDINNINSNLYTFVDSTISGAASNNVINSESANNVIVGKVTNICVGKNNDGIQIYNNSTNILSDIQIGTNNSSIFINNICHDINIGSNNNNLLINESKNINIGNNNDDIKICVRCNNIDIHNNCNSITIGSESQSSINNIIFSNCNSINMVGDNNIIYTNNSSISCSSVFMVTVGQSANTDESNLLNLNYHNNHSFVTNQKFIYSDIELCNDVSINKLIIRTKNGQYWMVCSKDDFYHEDLKYWIIPSNYRNSSIDVWPNIGYDNPEYNFYGMDCSTTASDSTPNTFKMELPDISTRLYNNWYEYDKSRKLLDNLKFLAFNGDINKKAYIVNNSATDLGETKYVNIDDASTGIYTAGSFYIENDNLYLNSSVSGKVEFTVTGYSLLDASQYKLLLDLLNIINGSIGESTERKLSVKEVKYGLKEYNSSIGVLVNKIDDAVFQVTISYNLVLNAGIAPYRSNVNDMYNSKLHSLFSFGIRDLNNEWHDFNINMRSIGDSSVGLRIYNAKKNDIPEQEDPRYNMTFSSEHFKGIIYTKKGNRGLYYMYWEQLLSNRKDTVYIELNINKDNTGLINHLKNGYSLDVTKEEELENTDIFNDTSIWYQKDDDQWIVLTNDTVFDQSYAIFKLPDE